MTGGMTGEASRPTLSLRVLHRGADVVVHPEGVVDFVTAPTLRAVLMHLLDADRAVVLALCDVELLDASSGRMLSAVYRHAGAPRGGLRAYGATGSVATVLELTQAPKPLRLTQPPTSTVDGGEDWTVEALLAARSGPYGDGATGDRLRELAIRHGYSLAGSLARRYRGRSEPLEDLTQVALLGLLKAIDGYDPGYANGFAAYAVPTITGELKRHFRDNGWQIRVPRRLQELRLELPAAGELLAHRLGRWPTVPELAAHLGISDGEIAQTFQAADAYRAASLSAPLAQDGEAVLGDSLGGADPGFEAVDNRESLRRLLPALPARQQRILAMRFYANMTQAQIAANVGLSQMHVSRLLTDALTRLRGWLSAG